MTRFSARTPPSLAANVLTRTLAGLRAAGVPVLDLTESNPTRVGLRYPDGLVQALGDPRGLRYEPSGPGLPEARRAVAGDYERRGMPIDPDRVILTASTSEAYSFLFKLLCNPGDAVLTPQPSYPLFDHLTRLDGVRPVPYRIDYHGRWSVDFASVAAAASSDARVVLAVSPNNPTGSVLRRHEAERLVSFCRERALALVSDEVFADYPLSPPADAAFTLVHQDEVLTFGLGGLSKTVGLPQAKLAWIAVRGPDAHAREAVERLEMIADMYLSVSTAVQLAAGLLLGRGAAVRAQIAARVRANHETLVRAAARRPACRVLHADAGWAGVLQVPATRPEEDLVLTLLEEDHVLVHPGYFFDFPAGAFLVMSLLVAPDVFATGVERVLARVGSPG